jgi:polypeptide N-acetylgalactosaminyltransferase
MMLRKFRLNSCRVILVTSLVWFIADVIILAFYFDSLTNLKKSNDNEREGIHESHPIHAGALQMPPKDAEKEPKEETGLSVTYKASLLKPWKPAKVVKPQYGLPGEQGKGVQIPADQEAFMKEKFKLNQFNILASDKISLNRSLADVRHDK